VKDQLVQQLKMNVLRIGLAFKFAFHGVFQIFIGGVRAPHRQAMR